jgi:hypothetical protein
MQNADKPRDYQPYGREIPQRPRKNKVDGLGVETICFLLFNTAHHQL